jgi:hypothetical protein
MCPGEHGSNHSAETCYGRPGSAPVTAADPEGPSPKVVTEYQWGPADRRDR